MNAQPTHRPVYPLWIVLAALGIIEAIVGFVYLNVSDRWERIPLLALIVLIPLSVVATFLYLWIWRPGHLYPPSEFGTDASSGIKLQAFYCNLTGPMSFAVDEFSKCKDIIKRHARGESAICITSTRDAEFVYGQCSFSREKGEPGIFKFTCPFEDLHQVLPVLTREHRVKMIITDSKELLDRIASDRELGRIEAHLALAA